MSETEMVNKKAINLYEHKQEIYKLPSRNGTTIKGGLRNKISETNNIIKTNSPTSHIKKHLNKGDLYKTDNLNSYSTSWNNLSNPLSNNSPTEFSSMIKNNNQKCNKNKDKFQFLNHQDEMSTYNIIKRSKNKIQSVNSNTRTGSASRYSKTSNVRSPPSFEFTVNIESRPEFEYSKLIQNKKFSQGEKLYENSKLIKAKIENRRNEENLKRKNNMTPNITGKARNIVRNPRLFGERLYPSHLVREQKNSSNMCNKYEFNSGGDLLFRENDNIEELYGKDSFRGIYRKIKKSDSETFIHQPQLNNKSIRMAERMELSITRLTKKKKKYKNLSMSENSSHNFKKDENSENSFNNDIKNSNNLLTNSKSSYICNNFNNLNISKQSQLATQRSMNHSNQLYKKGIELMNKKQIVYEEKKKKDSEFYKNFNFKPSINNTRSRKLNSVSNKISPNSSVIQYLNNKDSNFYQRNEKWKNSILSKSDNLKNQDEKKIIAQCTFTPNIENKIPEPDIKFISRNLNQINEYIIKRRAVLMKQEEDKEYANSKLNFGKNYKVKTTIPKEFMFNHSKSRKCLNSQNNPLIIYNANLITEIRRKLSTESFFNPLSDYNSSIIYFNDHSYENNMEGSSNHSIISKKNLDVSNLENLNKNNSMKEEQKSHLSTNDKSKHQFRSHEEQEDKDIMPNSAHKLYKKLLNLKLDN